MSLETNISPIISKKIIKDIQEKKEDEVKSKTENFNSIEFCQKVMR